MFIFRSADGRALSESIYNRERRIQQLLMRFRHSPESSFVEYAPRLDDSGEGGTDMVYTNPERSLASEANNRYREIRERRMQRQMERRQLRNIMRHGHATSSREHHDFRSSLLSTASATSTRPIDDWAINRRLTLQQNHNDPMMRLNR